MRRENEVCFTHHPANPVHPCQNNLGARFPRVYSPGGIYVSARWMSAGETISGRWMDRISMRWQSNSSLPSCNLSKEVESELLPICKNNSSERKVKGQSLLPQELFILKNKHIMYVIVQQDWQRQNILDQSLSYFFLWKVMNANVLIFKRQI